MAPPAPAAAGTGAADAGLLQAFRRDGYVRIAGFLDAAAVAAARVRIDAIGDGRAAGIADGAIYFEDRSDPATLKQIQHLERLDPLFRDLLEGGAARRLAEALLEGPVVPRNMQYFGKPPGTGRPTPPHQDGFYFMLEPCAAVTMWLALDPADGTNGCVRYLRGSHAAGLQRHAASGVLGFSQGIEGYAELRRRFPEEAQPAAPGTLLAHHALTVHRADGNRSRTRPRRALGLTYYAASAREDRARHAAYQAELAAALGAGGRI